MKRIAVSFAALGLVLAGCGAGHRAASNVTTVRRSIVVVSSSPHRLVVSGTATIPHVKVGTEIACKGAAANVVTVPAPVASADSVEVDESGGWSGGPTSSIKVNRFSDGTATVTCSKK